MKEVIFYRTALGNCPVEEFLDSLSARQAQKIAWVLHLIEDFQSIPTQYFKKLTGTDELWEVRTEIGGDAFRLLGFLHGSRFVVLTHGFRKKTQKTPHAEIRLAGERRLDYIRRTKAK